MNDRQTALWERVRGFAIDEGTPARPFVDRLASENGWSPAYAARVVVEYKRFLFLSSAAGHPVSPSDAVDQAWHLHLTYTHSYWDRLCPEVLGKPLHHEPTRGGSAETAKFDGWYIRTRDSYRTLFGHDAPADIWPALADKDPAPHARVNLGRHFVIPRPRAASAGTVAAAGVLTMVVAAGCEAGDLNPFALKGPEFLGFYVLLFAAACVVSIKLRRWMRTPDDDPPAEALKIEPIEAAYLNSGGVMAVNATIVRLVDKGVLTMAATEAKLTIAPGVAHGSEPSLDKDSDALERAVVAAVARGETYVKQVRKAAEGPLAIMCARLTEMGLLVARGQRLKVQFVSFLVMAMVPLVGLLRIGQSLPFHTPIGYTVLLSVVFGIVALIVAFKAPFRTRRGTRTLKLLRDRHEKYSNVARAKNLHGPELALAVALFGTAVLATSPLAAMDRTLTPTGGGSSCSSGCFSSGGSGCSGGSSCGSSCGGGCGGGGD